MKSRNSDTGNGQKHSQLPGRAAAGTAVATQVLLS